MGVIYSEVTQRPLATEQGRPSILRNEWIQGDGRKVWDPGRAVGNKNPSFQPGV